MLALHADKIVAGRYSLVGSIGAVVTGWDFHKLAEKSDVNQRIYASGVHKNMLNPFVAMSKESEVKVNRWSIKWRSYLLMNLKRSVTEN